MATLRSFARSVIAGIRTPQFATLLKKSGSSPTLELQLQKRWESTISIGIGRTEKQVELPDFEVTKDPNEWKFVEWTLPTKVVPPAPTEYKEYSSGWKPPKPESLELPYFVGRSKNHMLAVYYRRSDRGLRRVTKVTKIQGNITLLAQELQDFLSKKLGKEIGMRVNEPAGMIKLRGDYEHLCTKFLENKGF